MKEFAEQGMIGDSYTSRLATVIPNCVDWLSFEARCPAEPDSPVDRCGVGGPPPAAASGKATGEYPREWLHRAVGGFLLSTHLDPAEKLRTYLRSAATGTIIAEFDALGSPDGMSRDVTPDGSTVALHEAGKVVVSDTKTRKSGLPMEFPGRVWGVAVGPGGKHLAVGVEQGVQLFDRTDPAR